MKTKIYENQSTKQKKINYVVERQGEKLILLGRKTKLSLIYNLNKIRQSYTDT